MEAPETGSAFQLRQLAVAGRDDSIADEALLDTLKGLGDVAMPEGDGLSNASILRPQE